MSKPAKNNPEKPCLCALLYSISYSFVRPTAVLFNSKDKFLKCVRLCSSFELQIQRKLERKWEARAELEAKVIEASNSKVCTVEAAAHNASKARSALLKASLCSDVLCVAQGHPGFLCQTVTKHVIINLIPLDSSPLILP